MAKYLYNDYIKRLSDRFEAELTSIQAGYNFDYGDEFEVALCRILRSVLPDSYGVCRGHVVDKDGNQAGDDIIIYEQIRFPTLGLRDKDDYSRKEFIPIEAVYCYIEAKHTVNLIGDKEDKQSLFIAMSQTSRVKEVCLAREKVQPNQITPYFNIGSNKVEVPEDFPSIRNPVFTVVIANQVRDKRGGKILDSTEEIDEVVTNSERDEVLYPPDLIILGKDNIVVPSLIHVNKYHSPFWVEGSSEYVNVKVKGIAFAIGLASIMWALDWIDLGTLPWKRIIADGLGLSFE